MSWSESTAWSPLKREACALLVSDSRIVSGGGSGGAVAIFLMAQPTAIKLTNAAIPAIPNLRFMQAPLGNSIYRRPVWIGQADFCKRRVQEWCCFPIKADYHRLGHFAQGFVPALIAREVLLRRKNCFATRMAVLHRIEYLPGNQRSL